MMRSVIILTSCALLLCGCASSPRPYPLPKFPFYNDNPATEKYILNCYSKINLHQPDYSEDPRLHLVYLESYEYGFSEAMHGRGGPLDLFDNIDIDDFCASMDGYYDGQKVGRRDAMARKLKRSD
jgi:hypothetical protein